MITADRLSRRLERIEQQDGVNVDGPLVLLVLPDNSRDPRFGCGRTGNVIIYDEEHPAESFLTERDLNNGR